MALPDVMYKGDFDITQYKASYADKQRLKDIEIVNNPDGGYDIVDHSPQPWQPTQRQSEFFQILFDSENPGYLDMYEAMRQMQPPGTYQELRRWCNTSVQFTAHFKEVVKERVELANIGADMIVTGTMEGKLKPDNNQKWAVKMLKKMEEFAHQREIRWVQINQQFNMGPMADQDDEELMRVINDAGDIAAKTVQAVIESGKGEGGR